MTLSLHEADRHISRIRKVVEQGVDDDTVSRSWRRCINDYGLDPRHPRTPSVLTQGELDQRRERHGSLIDSARMEMSTLFQQLADPEVAVVLVDTEGAILHMVAAPLLKGELAPLGLRPGAIWSEREAGTNGMGTCLAAAEPVAIQQRDHFFTSYASLTCSAVPVLDQRGDIAAVLDVTSRSTLLQQHSLVLIGTTSRMIENRLLDASYEDAFPIHFHSRPESIYTAHEGKLLVSADGAILAANTSAVFQLGCASQAELRTRRVDDIFQSSLEDILQRTMRSSFHPVPIYRAGASSRFFAVAQQPRAAVADRQSSTRRYHPASAPAAPSAQPDAAGWRMEFGDARVATQFALAQRVVSRGVPLLLRGETGVGKEVFAQSLHRRGPRAAGPFVAVNCASLPEHLIESELFGYRAGAFTGAQRQGRRGLVLQADKGTLFLDEIGDMPLLLQARLLRVLDERKITPLGTETPIDVDVHLISASHRNLAELVQAGLFREDLYYRLNGVEITLPAVRERDDRAALIEHILNEEAGEPVRLDAQAQAALMRFSWPGNLRQMRHVLRTLAVLRDDTPIGLQQLPAVVRDEAAALALGGLGAPVDVAQRRALGFGLRDDATPAPMHAAEDDARACRHTLNPIQANEREVLLRLLTTHRWNISYVAKTLDISRNTLYRKLHRLDIPLSSSESGERR